MRKKRVAAIMTLIAFVLAGCGFGIYKYDRTKRFEFAEKNSFAMGTIVSQKVYAPYGAKHAEKVNLLIAAIEDVISRNVESSAVSRLNLTGSVSDKDTASIVRTCTEVSEKTGGAFDITVGGVVDLWKIGSDDARVPDEKELQQALGEVGYKNLTAEGTEITLESEAKVDLGAVGKGIACDSAVAYYRAIDGCSGAIVSVGGSIGCFGSYNKAGDKWKIAIRHPRQENAFLGVIELGEGFVSTSGDYEKYFIEDSVRYHHILDARTGRPASSGLISVTVVCDSGFLSDALSTACFILGKEKSEPLLEAYGASAIFVDEDLEITTVGEIDFERY
ncbi:MAG: FAD:protein FMN transferase [Ruminococcaceae bacterium]|nr:FAD:protein FMN transferase [Oscillospiraceae bacterium]